MKAIGARAPFTRRVPLKNMLQTVRSEKNKYLDAARVRECDEVADETLVLKGRVDSFLSWLVGFSKVSSTWFRELIFSRE